MLVAISLPPTTEEQKPLTPTVCHPGRSTAHLKAAPMAPTAARAGVGRWGDDLTTELDGERSEHGCDPSRPGEEPACPSPHRRVRETDPFRHPSHSGRTHGDLRQGAHDRLGDVQALHEHEAREQGMGHLASPTPQPRDEDRLLATGPTDEPAIAGPLRHGRRARRAVRPGKET